MNLEDVTNIPVAAFRYNESISNVNISESVALQKLLSLKDNKSPGPDGLHSYVLKSCAHTLCAPLTKLFQQSLAEGILPDEWKQAYVIPVLKKGSGHKVTNYRPISLTSIVVKILESVICTELLNFLSENDTYSEPPTTWLHL